MRTVKNEQLIVIQVLGTNPCAKMKTLSKVLSFSLLLLVLQAQCVCGAELPAGTPARVSDLGDPTRLLIEGTTTFTAYDIRRALRADLDYLVASQPEAGLAECLSALEGRVRTGYRHSGFPEVAVQAHFDVSAGRFVVKVTEGPRYRCGALQVTGLKALPVTDTDFTRRFAEKLVPASGQTKPISESLWKTGAPVSFTADSLAAYSAAASNTFAALGRFAPIFKVEVQPQAATGTAALAVIVDDEGPQALPQNIEVVGNKRNRREAVIGFLELSPRMAVTQDLVDEKARALTQAARFTDSSITAKVLGPNGQVSLRIAVVENGRLPPLQQPLSREERTMLRLREWLLAWDSRQDDLIASWSPPTEPSKAPHRIEAIVAPSGGIVARVMGTSPGLPGSQALYSMVVNTNTLALFAQVHQRKLRAPLPAGYSGIFFLKLGSCTNCPSGISLTLGAGVTPAKAKTGWQVRLDLLPAAFTDLLCRPGTEATWQGDVLTVRTEDLMARVEEGTGRLLELGLTGGKSTSSTAASDSYRVVVRFASGAFARAVDQIAVSTTTHADAFQGKRALGSTLGFVAAELAGVEPLWSSSPGGHPPQPRAALASALEKLLASSFLDPLQAILDATAASGRNEEFTIPTRQVKHQDSTQQMFNEAAVWCAGHSRELAPAGSWLQTLLRESAFTLNSRTEHTSAAVACLAASEDIGPIGCFVGLHALLPSNQDSWSRFRDLGLKRLATDDFRRDYRMLLSPESVITRCLANLTRELGMLKEPEAGAIAGLLPPDAAAVMRQMAAAARKAKDLPMADAIGPVLDRWWETTAREKVAADFRSHAQSSAAATLGGQLHAATAQVYFPAGLAAVVNGRPIFDSEIRERMSPTVETLRRQYPNNPAMLEQKLKEHQLDALERLIEDELILNEATEAGREVTEKHLDLYIQNQIQTRYYDSNVFLKALAAQGATIEVFRERHRRDDLIGAARREKSAAISPPTPEQIEQYYRAHEKDFRVAESVKLSLIVINKNTTNGPAAVELQRKLAAEIHARAAEGGDFANLAQLYSQGSQAKQGGDWGWVERPVLRKELGDAAFSLKPGGLSDVIETEEACFIMRVADRRPGALKSMAEVRDDIAKTLQTQHRSAAIKQWLAKLRAEGLIQYQGGGVGTARSQEQAVGIEITHIGVSTVNDAVIRSHLRVKEGELITQANVDHDLQSLYGTGHFYNIRVGAKSVPGGIKLIYAVQEKPVLNDIQFTGNKNMNSRELLAKLTSKTGERLDEWKLFNDSRTIQSIYQTAGYPQVVVKYALKIEEKAGRGSVTFEITEGSQARMGNQKVGPDIASLKARAEQGDPDAQCKLGLAYSNGKGVPNDGAAAVTWYRKAAEQGHAKAEYLLGRVLLLGASGVRADSAEALEWVRRSAEQGYSYAQLELGLALWLGTGAPKDAEEAVKWLRKAAEQGNAQAQGNLAHILHTGQGVPKDAVAGHRWCREAAEQGDSAAQLDLGLMFAEGNGVPANTVHAYMWINLAATRGLREAVTNRARLEKQMPPEAVAEAKRLSAQFVPHKCAILGDAP